jgi:hypothetical protein
VREVETKFQPTAMPTNPPGSTPEKHKKFRVYTALMKSAVAISDFFGANFRTVATEKLGNFLEKIAKVSKPRIRNLINKKTPFAMDIEALHEVSSITLESFICRPAPAC